VRLEVRDAGRLAQAAAAPSHPAGSGLGLTLVRQIASAGLGGDFDLRPRPDGSTVAVLRFNLQADADPDR
jgi:signal transduction histidine kinase